MLLFQFWVKIRLESYLKVANWKKIVQKLINTYESRA